MKALMDWHELKKNAAVENQSRTHFAQVRQQHPYKEFFPGVGHKAMQIALGVCVDPFFDEGQNHYKNKGSCMHLIEGRIGYRVMELALQQGEEYEGTNHYAVIVALFKLWQCALAPWHQWSVFSSYLVIKP